MKAATASGPVEGPWVLPQGWRWERLGNVATVNPRTDFSGIPTGAPVTFIRMAALAELTGQFDLTENRPVEAVSKGYTRFQSGDVLFAKITPCMENGKLGVVPPLPFGMGAGSTEFHVLRPAETLDGRFLFQWLSRKAFREEAEFNMTGTAGQRRVPTDYMSSSLVPVPPLETQRRLNARIDALSANVTAGENALLTAKASLGQWRQALLKAAVTGDLTADWRAANPPTETGEALLAHILADRRARWSRDPRNKTKRYPEPPPPDTIDLPALPDGWAWASLAQVAEINPAISSPASGEVPFIGMAAVEAETGRIDASERREVAKVKTGFTRFAAGDVLFAKITPCMENGKIAVVPEEVGSFGAGSTEFHVIRSEWLPPSFLWAFLVQKGTRQEAERNMTGTAGQMRVPKPYLENLAVPIGPRAELEVAIKRLADLNSQTDPIEAIEQDGTAKAQSLRQSILAAAFRGELAA